MLELDLALYFSGKTVSHLRDGARSAVKDDMRAKDEFHLTLFIAQCSDLERVKKSVGDALSKEAVPPMSVNHFILFPDKNLLAFGVTATKELLSYQSRLAGTIDANISQFYQINSWVPHITIGKVPRFEEAHRFDEITLEPERISLRNVATNLEFLSYNIKTV